MHHGLYVTEKYDLQMAFYLLLFENLRPQCLPGLEQCRVSWDEPGKGIILLTTTESLGFVHVQALRHSSFGSCSEEKSILLP